MILLLNFKNFFENSCWVFYDFVLYSNLYRKSKNYKTCVSCDPSWGGGGGGFERSSVLSHFTSHDLNSNFQKLYPNNKRNTPEHNTPPLMTPTTDQKFFSEYVCVESYLMQYRKSKSIFSFAEPAITLSHL